MYYIDQKYLLLVSSQLKLFKKKNDGLYNFRCPYCGDSKKSQTKARGFMFRKENSMIYKCHNCGVGASNFGMQGNHHHHHDIDVASVREASKQLRVSDAQAQHETVSNHRRLKLQQWFGSSTCYYRDEVTRRFMVGVAIGTSVI